MLFCQYTRRQPDSPEVADCPTSSVCGADCHFAISLWSPASLLNHFVSKCGVSWRWVFIHTASSTAMLWVRIRQWYCTFPPGFAWKNSQGTLQLLIAAKVTPLHQYVSSFVVCSSWELTDTEEQETNHCLNIRWCSRNRREHSTKQLPAYLCSITRAVCWYCTCCF